MRKLFLSLFMLILLGGCKTPNVLSDMRFQTTPAPPYLIANWYKITEPGKTLKVYIEGDGNAFDKNGFPTDNPTPKNIFLRKIAAEDPSPNVVYLGRPCQYVKAGACSEKDWTIGRFSKKIIDSSYKVINGLKKKAKAEDVILIGYSGGASVAGLIAVKDPKSVKGVLTIAGVLDHKAWTDYHGDTPLSESENLIEHKKVFDVIPQHHFVGEKDDVVPPKLVQDFVNDDERITLLPKASHDSGFSKAVKEIYLTR